MKTRQRQYLRLLIVGLFIITILVAQATASDSIQSEVKEVTLYLQGALVKSTAEVSLNSGRGEYIISGLSPYLKDETLQLKVEPPEVVVLQSRVFDTFLREPFMKKRQTLMEEIKHLKEEIARQEALLRSIETTLELARKKDTCGRSLKECLTETGPIVEGLFLRQAKIQSEIERLRDKKARLEKELQGLGTGEKTKALALVLEAPETVHRARVTITYFVDRARWWPYYILSVDTEKSEVKISYMAQIEQKTSEDWHGVKVTLSTGKPFFWGVLPEPEPWEIDLYSPPPPRPLYRAMALMKAPMPGERPSPKIAEEKLSFSIDLPGSFDIPSGPDKTKTVTVAEKSLPVKLSYRAYPSTVEKVFLEAILKNPFRMPIFQGPVTVFVDGALTNRASINDNILPEAQTRIALGVDPSLKIKRSLKRKFTETHGLFSKEEKTRYEFEIEVVNGKSIPVELRLQDRFPRSKNEKVVVRRIRPTPEEAEISPEGIITWSLRLNPHQRKKLPLVFTVSYPEGQRVVGLP